MFTCVPVTCNFQQHICYTSCLTFSANHWIQEVTLSLRNDIAFSHLHLLLQPSLQVQRKQWPSCCRVSWSISSQALRDISPAHIQPYAEPSLDRSSCFPSPTKKRYFTWLFLIMKASSLCYFPTTSSTSYTFQLYQSNSQACHSPLGRRSLVH